MPNVATGPKKRKKKKLLILSARHDLAITRALTDPALDTALNKTYEHEWTLAEAGAVAKMNAVYVAVDTADDVDNFEPCTVTSVPESEAFTDKMSELVTAVESLS